MDPNEVLGRILQLAEMIQADKEEPNCMDPTDVIELSELILTLNGWIQGGGFLPRLWAQDKRDKLEKLDE